MRTAIAALIVLAGAAQSALAIVNTRIDWQVSLDGVNWSSNVFTAPGDTVGVRALFTYTGTESPIGLASHVFQPIVSNWRTDDTLLPFINGGMGGNTSTPVGVISGPQLNDLTSFGRVSPWARSALSSTSALHGHYHVNPDGTGINYLRIAQAQVTAWLGGPGNTTGGSGVPISQLSDVGRTSADPPFSTLTANIYVFKFGIHLTDQVTFRDMVIDSPPMPGSEHPTFPPIRQVYWFASTSESTGSIQGDAMVSTAVIHTIPAPATPVVGVLGVAAIARRRRPVAPSFRPVQGDLRLG